MPEDRVPFVTGHVQASGIRTQARQPWFVRATIATAGSRMSARRALPHAACDPLDPWGVPGRFQALEDQADVFALRPGLHPAACVETGMVGDDDGVPRGHEAGF